MLQLKFDVLPELKKKGYTTYVIRKKNLLSSIALGHLRRLEVPDVRSLGAICCMLDMQPGDVVYSIQTIEEKLKYSLGND